MSQPPLSAPPQREPSTALPDKKYSLIITALFLLYALLLTPLGNHRQPEIWNSGFYNIQRIDPGDDTGYYAYLRSGIIDGDFDFFNEKGFWHFDAVTDTGYTANYWYIGAPILWLPFFLIGHVLAVLYSFLGYPVQADGYSFPYLSMTYLGSAMEGFLGLLLLNEMLKKKFPSRTALVATLLLLAATCLPYFIFIRNRMSHTGDLLVGASFFLMFLRFRDNPSQPRGYFVLWGALAGLAADLRYINLVYCVLPLLQAVALLRDPARSAEEMKRLLSNYAWAVAAFVIAFLPQLAAWKKIHGVFSSLNPYTVALSLTPAGVLKNIGILFFSPIRGLAVTEPIWIAGLAGLFLLLRRDRMLALGCLLVFAGFCVAPLVIVDPATFGQRYLIPAFPALAFGLAEICDIAFRKKMGIMVAVAGGLAALWLYVLLINAIALLVFNDPQFYLRSLENIPALIRERLFAHPVSYPMLLIYAHPGISDFIDAYFLAIFPALFILTPFAIVALLKITLRALESEKQAAWLANAAGWSFLTLTAAITLFALARHPELSPEEKVRRLRISAATMFILDSPGTETMEKRLARAEKIEPADRNLTAAKIRADAAFLSAKFDQAAELYRPIIAAEPNSPALLQLERIESITGRHTITPDLIQQLNSLPDADGSLHRLAAIYYLDHLRNSNEAMALFQASLNINPAQAQAEGIKRLIRHYFRQVKNMARSGPISKQMQMSFLLLLNTEINELRLDHNQRPMQF